LKLSPTGKLNDPIEKYLPSKVIIPQYNGHKITIEDLATHTSGLPEFPDNYCPSFNRAAAAGV
jgi:CubicO group peptidase (beta-lactamase class C family)